jgi:hypothetical protein
MNKILIPNKSHRNDNTWASMVGANWLFHLRILHPAERLSSDGSWRPVRWKEIASADIDLATASWFDVSKVQLHSGPSGDGWDREPDIGPEDVRFRVPLLKCLFKENPTTIWVGQWDGWGNFSKPKQASKLEIPSMLRSYYVVALTQTLEESLTNCEKPDVLPDLIWDEAGTFMCVSDIDLPSTIVGCNEEIAERLLRNPALETVRINSGAPIVI